MEEGRPTLWATHVLGSWTEVKGATEFGAGIPLCSLAVGAM